MTTRKDSIIEKIRALMARANHANANEYEAVACAAKAAELMQKYGIESTELKERAVIGHETRPKIEGWKEQLAVVISQAFGVEVVKARGMTFFTGENVGLEIGLYIFDQLANKIDALSKAYAKEWFADFERTQGVDYKAFAASNKYFYSSRGYIKTKSYTAQRNYIIKSFCHGVVQSLFAKMVKPKHAQPQTEGLVLIQNSIDEYQKNVLGFENITTKRIRSMTVDADAMDSGRTTGKNLSVNSGLGSKTSQKLLG